jgi:large subunit ribosomal protein L25
MTDTQITLNASRREETGKKVEALRDKGMIPAVLYGHGLENINLVIKYSDLERILNKTNESELIDLVIDNKETEKVLIHDIQRDSVKHLMTHVDFYQVRMDEKIKTEIEINFLGEAPAVKELGGVLLKNLDKLEVECLPGNIPNHIDVDLSTLKTFDDIIRVKDVQVPETVHILNDMEIPVTNVAEPRKIEEEPVAESENETPADDKEKQENAEEKSAE